MMAENGGSGYRDTNPTQEVFKERQLKMYKLNKLLPRTLLMLLGSL